MKWHTVEKALKAALQNAGGRLVYVMVGAVAEAILGVVSAAQAAITPLVGG